MRVGVLHPGNMGAALAGCVGAETLWASEGRSEATASRARGAGITDVGSPAEMVAAADIILSVCPPAAALEVAEQTSEMSFDGLYVDMNAVSPATTRRIGRLHARCVDGAIIGPPPTGPSARDDAGSRPSSLTHLYLSGEEADAVSGLFTGSSIESRVIGSELGRASALKMAYAGWTKGTSALLLSVAALATSEGVISELVDEWDTSIPELRDRLQRVSARIGTKAWRFVGEMEEIARTHGEAGLPEGFHLAAAEIYSRLADLKDSPSGQLFDDIAHMLLDGNDDQ